MAVGEYVKPNKTVSRVDKRTRHYKSQWGAIVIVGWMVALVIAIETGIL